MSRALIVVLLLVVLAAGGSLLAWYFAYEVNDAPPSAAPVAHLAEPASIAWQANGVARITAASLSDAVAALGYVHGTQRTWSLALWRQTALGRLGEWFGRGMVPLDRHARQLGLGPLAQEAYAQLPDSTQRLLTAYTSGVNAALDAGAAQQHDELLLLDLAPAPWQPWHSLAIERLVGWLATSPPADSTISASTAAVRRFVAEDATFRHWLHVHGLERSIAWGVRGAQGPVLFQRHVYGTSALPLVEAVILDVAGEPAWMGAALPGTPFLVTGRSGRGAWSTLLHSPMRLTLAPVDSSALRTVHERIRFRDGGETLFTTSRAPGQLPLGPPDARPVRPGALPDTLSAADSIAAVDSIRTPRRSVWQVEWTGLRPVSDASAWLALPHRPAPPFTLMSGRGLHLDRNGTWTVVGEPPVVARFDNGMLVGQSPWAQTQARVLRTQLDAPPSVEALSARDSSTWAAQGASSVLPFLLRTEPQDTLLSEAVTYLRNWDYAYDRASIGASIFESWLRAHRATTDSLPFIRTPAPRTPPEDSLAYVQWTDSLRADSLRRSRQLQSTLRQAVDSLMKQFGPDPRRWRWEHVRTTPRYFPVWSADSLVGRDLAGLSNTRYAAVERPGRGHPSTLSGGTSLLDAAPAPAAAWEGWTSAAPAAPFMARRPRMYIDRFLGRYAAPDRPPPPFALRDDTAATATTQLRPSP